MEGLPAAERAYLAALVERAGAGAAGVCLTGSAAAGAYVPGASDLDVLVVGDGLDVAAIAARCAHKALPCPAVKLELVVYETGGERWVLNLNTGPGVHHVGTDPTAEPAHWFVLDRAFARTHGVALAGPPPAELLAPVPEEALRAAHADAVAWYAAHAPGRPAVTAACRAWHWLETGELATKPAALAWARARL